MTAQELGDEVLKMLNIVAASDTPSVAQRAAVLALFNAMTDAWNVEGLLSPYKDTGSYTLTINDNEYTIASAGADFAAPRPLEIEMAVIRDSTGVDSDLAIVSWKEFERLYDSVGVSGRPTYMTYKKGFPLGTIKVGPKPDAAYALRLTTVNLFGTAVANTNIDNNPGYLEAFKYNLATRTAIYYSRPIEAGIIIFAENSLRGLRRKSHEFENAPIPTGIMQGRGGYDIDRGE